ncbi:MAG: 16S rRNA (guanine(527)-N(7))-methyltransferase RsmG [Schleiferiaceae bacterium]|nr:16S rRNA (guanine(527)-N(7))-methyltransferase RsmG [Schleiferiaceae bacterium]
MEKFQALKPLYDEWNAQINVISRKDMDAFFERHVLHSLGVAKVQPFLPGASILDVGTGGGFPGIPLAVLFPETQFLLVDSIGKKIKVVDAVAEALELQNVRTLHGRAESVKEKFDFVVSRAVTQMPDFYRWVKGKFKKEHLHERENGILYLKGGDLRAELAPFGKERCKVFQLTHFFNEPFFETKAVVWLKGH